MTGRVAEMVRREASGAAYARDIGGALSRAYHIGRNAALRGDDPNPERDSIAENMIGAYLDGYHKEATR